LKRILHHSLPHELRPASRLTEPVEL
jgi:hypothetical protein